MFSAAILCYVISSYTIWMRRMWQVKWHQVEIDKNKYGWVTVISKEEFVQVDDARLFSSIASLEREFYDNTILALLFTGRYFHEFHEKSSISWKYNRE